MAKKVYRLHEGQDGTGWFVSKALTTADLETIKTDGKDVATSIPSPFARFDLVKSAFRWVAANNIEGKTAHHKLVSDSLDIAQLFFKSQQYKDCIKIIAWNPKERIKDLMQQLASVKHSELASTLNIFWDQDGGVYNFNRINRLYFILNKENNQIIGGTSPATLFAASPDARKFMGKLKITCGQDVLLDDEYTPLHKREIPFVEYIYSLSKQDNFPIFFPEFFSYIEEIRKNFLAPALKSKVSNFTINDLSQYKPCPVLENSDDPCEILGIPLGLQHENISSIELESDFVIKSEIPCIGRKPLVLPHNRFSNRWTYTTQGVFWDEKTNVPAKNISSPESSILPVQNDQYYWFSIGNFLEEKIIELPYSIDSTKFELCGSKKYLLPLTETFFKYFKSENVSKYLKLVDLSGGGIEATLEIPVKAGNITFKKIYSKSDILKIDVHLAITPFIKVESVPIDYTFGVLDSSIDQNFDFHFKCFYKGKEVSVKPPVVRSPGLPKIKSLYYKLFEAFDFIRFGIPGYSGCIIPIMKPYSNSSKKINFAIDFGTTNTHIEYYYDDIAAISLDNPSETPFWQSLINRKDSNIDKMFLEYEDTFDEEILPFSFSEKNSHFHFPFRTALVSNKQIGFDDKVEIFRHVNNYMLFEKSKVKDHLDIYTQLKWSNYADSVDEKKVECYIEYLITLVYYKTLLLGGDINKTSITWFYPVSMDEGELGIFFKLWGQVYKKVFHIEPNDNLIKGIPESIAPYLYYKSSIAGLSLSIDIGGGSSDIAVFDEDEQNAKIISSFKFAGNAIFGDGYPSKELKNDSDKNGFVKTFRVDAERAVAGDDKKEPILKNILNVRKDSADFSSFLFSLEIENQRPFNYTRLLEKDRKLKLSIFIFYSAIAYYSANLLKKCGIGIPKNILLSGTAAKTVSIIDSSGEKLKNISGLYKFIFEKVYNETVKADISFSLSSIPKAITCKGALKGEILSSISLNNIKFWIGGLNDNEWNKAVDKEKEVHQTPKYRDINDSVKSDLNATIIDFYAILDQYITSINLEAKFNIDSIAYDIFKQIRVDCINDYLVRGIKAFYKREDKHIEETLFFYPLIGILNKLSNELSSQQN